MGLGWAIVAFFLPGIPQLLHLDLLKVIIIWFLPAMVGATGGLMGLAGPVLPVLGIVIFLYNLSTAFSY
jgi:hypothetical protein